MPVILAEDDWPKWLGEEPATEEELLGLLKPCPDEALKIWPVNKAVGNVRNKGRELIEPLALLVQERRMTPGEFQALYPQVIGWIRQTLAAHEKSAKSVASAGFVRLPHYFSQNLLASTKYVAVDRVPTPPLSTSSDRFA
jgi:hypothetical protein